MSCFVWGTLRCVVRANVFVARLHRHWDRSLERQLGFSERRLAGSPVPSLSSLVLSSPWRDV